MQKFESDSSLIVFISCHGSLVPRTLKLLVDKMTALIDMPKLVKKNTDQKKRSIDKDQILEPSIIVKRFQLKNLDTQDR